MSRPHQERCEGTAAWWDSAVLSWRVAMLRHCSRRLDGPGAETLVAQDVVGPCPGLYRADAGHSYCLPRGGEPGAVVGVAAREDVGERAVGTVAGQVDFASQAASGASEAGSAGPFVGPRRRAGGHGRRWSRPTSASRCLLPSRRVSGPPGACARRCRPATTGEGGGAAWTTARTAPAHPVRPSRCGTPHDPVEHPAVVQPLPVPQRHRQQWSDELPLGLGEFLATYHRP